MPTSKQITRSCRGRGFTMIETVLVFATVLGAVTGSVMYYMQLDGAAQKNDKLKMVNAVAAEMRALSESYDSLDDIEDPSTVPPVTQGKNVKDAAIANMSGINISTFVSLDVVTDGQDFYIHLFDLDRSICRNLSNSDFGLGERVASVTDCDGGVLSIHYPF